jgi:hypothetical protein
VNKGQFTAYYRLQDAQKHLCGEVLPDLWDIWYNADSDERQQLDDSADQDKISYSVVDSNSIYRIKRR